jgi:hypothetical protein
LDTPKFLALDSILSNQAPIALGGKIVPGTIEGADFSVANAPWLHPAPAGAETSGGVEFSETNNHKGYLFRVVEEGRYSISLSYRQTNDVFMEIMVDGTVIAKENISGTESRSLSVHLTPGLHGIRVKKMDPGYFFLNAIRIR